MEDVFHHITETLRGETQLSGDGSHSQIEAEVLQGVVALRDKMLQKSKDKSIGYSFRSLQHLKGSLVIPSPFLGGLGSLIFRRYSIHFVPNTSERPLSRRLLLGTSVDPTCFRQYLKDLWNDCVCDVLAALYNNAINPFKVSFPCALTSVSYLHMFSEEVPHMLVYSSWRRGYPFWRCWNRR